MSQENVGLVKAWLDAWNRNDWDGMEQCFAADCEIYAPEDWLESSPFKGWPSFRREMERLKDSSKSERLEIDELRDLGERVLARWRWLTVGAQSEIASEMQVATVSTIRQGKIIRIDYFFDHAQALKAAGLSE